MAETAEYDLIIVGGGMVGATLAAALDNTELRIAVIDARQPPAFSADQPHDLRVSALSVASQRILENVGAWAGIQSRRCCPYRRMRVWEMEARGDTLFDSADLGEPALGHIVENRVIQLALWDRLERCRNVDLLSPVTIDEIDYQPSGSQLCLADGRVLRCRLLVGADGGPSRVRQQAGIGIRAREYAQHALVAYVETACPQQDITWQKFVPAGPLAFLPLTGNYASLVWYNHPAEVKRLLALPEEEFLSELYRTFPAELGEIRALKARGSFPLRCQHALEYVKSGVALVGDAAHMIHPLAGQGVNIGLLDAGVLASVIIEALAEHRDIGDASILRGYEKQRRQHNLTMMTVMDLFYRVFRQQSMPLRMARNLGLGLAQKLAPARKSAMRFAMGLEGPLPPLARKL